MNTTKQDPTIAATVDNIVASGIANASANGLPPQPTGPPPVLLPSEVEKVIARALESDEFRALLSDADLGPTCQAVQQIVQSGFKAQDAQPLAILVMMASWALWKWNKERDEVVQVGGAD